MQQRMDIIFNTPISSEPAAQPRRPQRRMRQAEAAESSAETDEDSSCIESDTMSTVTESLHRPWPPGGVASGEARSLHDAVVTHMLHPRCDTNTQCWKRGKLKHAESLLSTLCTFDDIWERVCDALTGDAIYALAQVPYFNTATKRTPAFICLAGLNNDAKLVPWEDADNVMSTTYVHHTMNNDRDILAIQLADRALSNIHCPYYKHHQYGGPARPSSPCESAYALNYSECIPLLDTPVYTLTNPHYIDFLQFHAHSPVFGITPGYHIGPRWPLLVGNEHDSDSD